MGRKKLEIKKLEDKTRRQVTYSKRRKGRVKKVYELSILCDIDIALIMFSQNGKLTLFSGKKRIENVLARYMNLPLHERQRARPSAHISADNSPKELQQEINRVQCQLEDARKKLRIFEGEPIRITSQAEAKYYEHMVLDALDRVINRKVGLNNASNQVEAEAGEKLAEIDNTTSQPPETYTAATPTIQWPETYAAATPAIHPPETSSPNKMKGKMRTYFRGESSNANEFLATYSKNNMERFSQRNHPQSTVECSHSSSMYSNMMNIIRMNLADHVGLNNASNQVEAEAGEKFAEIDNTTYRPPETYIAATPAIQWPETYTAASRVTYPPETSKPK
ncbi:hypothetical protein AMTRI_Chr10g2990 [Amborella trichopoda]